MIDESLKNREKIIKLMDEYYNDHKKSEEILKSHNSLSNDF